MESTAVLLVLSALAAGMASLTAVTVRWAAFTAGPLRASVVQFLLLMMTGMLLGILVYFAIRGTSGVVAGFWVAGAIMSASVVIVFVTFVRERPQLESGPLLAPRPAHRSLFLASVIGLVLANEFLMGWSFSLLSGELPVGFGPGADHLATILAGAVVSPWFVFPMALEMLLTLRWLVGEVPPSLRRYLLVQPVAMVCSPPTIGALPWAVGTAVGASAVMALAVAFLLLTVFRGDEVPPRVFAFGWRLIATFGVMAAGLYAWAVYGEVALFAVSLLLQMLLFLHASTDPSFYAASPRPSGAVPVVDGPSPDPGRTVPNR
jgi:hypothetical protein